MNEPIPPNRFSLFDVLRPLLPYYMKTIFVRADKFSFADIPAPGTTLQNTRIVSQAPNCDGCLNWQFAYTEPHRTDGWHAFYFVNPISNPTVPVLTLTEKDDHYWHAVLLDLKFIQDFGFPMGVNSVNSAGHASIMSGARLLPRYDLVPPSTEGTHFVIKLYFSNTPHAIGRSPSPQPSSVHAHFSSATFDHPECLHDDIIIEDQISAMDMYDATTKSGGSASGSVSGQFFPATNFRNRRPYIVNDRQDLMKAIYLRTQRWAHPPLGTRTVTADF
jgi:hypothetical protein